MSGIVVTAGETTCCGRDCSDFRTKWGEWARRLQQPCALLPLSPEYVAGLDRKSRAMVRKAELRGYSFREYIRDDELEAMYAINTSKVMRQGRPMTVGYRTELKVERVPELCDTHEMIWVGGFQNGELRAYASVMRLRELGVLNQIIGHADSLTDGVMNGLIAFLVSDLYERGVRWLNYLRMPSATTGLTDFKRSVGFSDHYLILEV